MATNSKATDKKPTAKIKLPLTRKEKDDVNVIINGKSYLIKRGVEVEVPLSVAKVLEQKERMLQFAMDFEAQATNLPE